MRSKEVRRIYKKSKNAMQVFGLQRDAEVVVEGVLVWRMPAHETPDARQALVPRPAASVMRPPERAGTSRQRGGQVGTTS
jgi:alkylhydroperoxidase family enzyme